ncbi:MAG: hypothetical protein C4K49_02205 [Candidatus Thorarchaeota archaeon]|nr:MAG: hypothetical protein C4K49_02205 [Candidatus Thorarchaeota archaeon]
MPPEVMIMNSLTRKRPVNCGISRLSVKGDATLMYLRGHIYNGPVYEMSILRPERAQGHLACVTSVLEYREFPIKVAFYYVLFSAMLAYVIYSSSRLILGTMFPSFGSGNLGLLGFGILAAVLTLLPAGVLADHTRYLYVISTLGALAPLLLGMAIVFAGSPGPDTPTIETSFTILLFSGAAFSLVSWCVQLNKTVVARFRGRVAASFLAVSLVIFGVYSALDSAGFSLYLMHMPIPEIITIAAVLTRLAFRPWRWSLHKLAVKGEARSYFIPTLLVMAAYILWYFGTQLSIKEVFRLAVDPSYVSLGQYSGLSLYEPGFMAVGVVFAGLIADTKGRKTALTFGVLLLGLLSIFGSLAYYNAEDGSAYLSAAPLLISERFVEGFLLGLMLLLIWAELGSPNTKGRRIAAMWIFFIGYIALLLAVSLGVWFGIDWYAPDWVRRAGIQFAILLTLVTLYWSAPLPEILGKELEMEDLSLDFDEKLVRQTAEAFVGAEDLKSIRSQLDILGSTEELSDKDMDEILGPDFDKTLPLGGIPGVGSKMEQRLREAGYESAAQLAGETPQRLSEKVKGLTPAKAEKILEGARVAVKKALKSKSKKEGGRG